MTKILDVCIVDSSAYWRNVVKDILCRELEKYGVTTCINEYSSPEQLRQLDKQGLSYDLLVADISDAETRKSDLNYYGSLCQDNSDMRLIFLASDPIAALDVFDYDTDYFIYKTELETRASAAVSYLLQTRHAAFEPSLVLWARSSLHVLKLKDIIYCEHAQRQTKVITRAKTVSCPEKLEEVYHRLAAGDFVRTHCSFLVNLQYVKELHRAYVVLSNGTTIPLSRANQANVREVFLQYKIKTDQQKRKTAYLSTTSADTSNE